VILCVYVIACRTIVDQLFKAYYQKSHRVFFGQIHLSSFFVVFFPLNSTILNKLYVG